MIVVELGGLGLATKWGQISRVTTSVTTTLSRMPETVPSPIVSRRTTLSHADILCSLGYQSHQLASTVLRGRNFTLSLALAL